VQNATLWRALLGVEKTVVEDIEFDEDAQVLLAHVRVRARAGGRCGRCHRRSPAYDRGEGRRRWRALDLGTVQVMLEAEAPRVNCAEHGPTVVAVPWARHAAGHTRLFDEQVAWLATQCSKSAVVDLMRVAWRTVGAIVTRVWADVEAVHDRFAALERIGIDEISYKRGHKYLTVIVDHATGRLVWAAPGRDQATLHGFFDALGPERAAALTHVSADSASWIANVVTDRAPQAVRCADPFHIVKWATEALDEVRREVWNNARKAAHPRYRGRFQSSTGHAKALKHARFALWKNPENLTRRQRAKLDWIATAEPRVHRAYLLKEGLRLIFQIPPEEAPQALEEWITWARRSRIDAFIALQRSIVRERTAILAAIEHNMSNGRIESVNTKIRLITRIAFGFANPDALTALALLNLGGHRPTLPGRQ